MVTRPKIMILSLVRAVFIGEYFYDVLGEELSHTKILVTDLSLGLSVILRYFIHSNL